MTAMVPPIVFNYGAFVAEFPEFGALSQAQAQGYFNRATLFCSNNTENPAFCAGVLGALLNLLTAHIAWLNAPRDSNGNPAATGSIQSTPQVGMLASGGQGSISVAFDIGDVAGSAPSQPYYMQTRYGAEYWFASAPFRTARYAARPTFVPNGIYTGRQRVY